MRIALPLAAAAVLVGGLSFAAPALAASPSSTSIACPPAVSLSQDLSFDDWSDYNAAMAACTRGAAPVRHGNAEIVLKKPLPRHLANELRPYIAS